MALNLGPIYPVYQLKFTPEISELYIQEKKTASVSSPKSVTEYLG
jgi:hypothetical protein